tara:strand:+ start:13661 stop:16408 length:2748 start_codon:yes stop_codon:yes gene_type:complete
MSASNAGNGQHNVGLTGSFIVARPGGKKSAAATAFPALPGQDVLLFVSGNIDGKGKEAGEHAFGVACFGGDLVASGAFNLEQMSAPSNTTDKLYNVGSHLYWDGVRLQSGSDHRDAKGSNTQVQYNNDGDFGGAADLTYNDSTGDVTIGASTTDAKLNFGDTGTYIYQSADGILDLVSDGNIELDAANSVKIDSDSGDISFEDGGVAQLALDMDGTAGEIIMQLKVDSDDFVFKQYDGTEVFRVEDNGDFDVAGGAGSSGVTITSAGQLTADGRVIVDDATQASSTTDGSLQTDGGLSVVKQGYFGGRVIVDDATDATSITDGSLQTDGGLSVVKDAVLGNDVKLLSDSAVLSFGADSDTTLTHTDGTGLTLNSTNKLTFGDAANYVNNSGQWLAVRAGTKLALTGANAQARAVDIGSAGGIYLGAQGGVGKDIVLTNGAGSVQLVGGEDDNQAVQLVANGTSGGIHLSANGKIDADAAEMDVDLSSGDFDVNCASGNVYTRSSGWNVMSGSRSSWPAVKLYSAQGAGGVHIEADNGALMRSNGGKLQFTGSVGSANAFAFKTTDAAGGIHFDVGSINMDTGTTLDIDATGALTIDSADSISIGTAADVALDVDSSTFDLDASGAITLDTSSGGISIDAAAGNVNVTSAAGTMSVTGASGASLGDDTGTWEFDGSGAVSETGMTSLSVTPSGAITLTAGAASTWSSSAGALTLTSAAAATWSTSAGALTVNGAGGLNLQEGGSNIIAVSDARALSVANVTTFEVDASSNIALESSGGTITLGGDDVNQNINIGTNGTRTIRIGEDSGNSTIALRGEAADIVIDAGSNDVSVTAASIQPSSDLGVDLGTAALRFGNIYTGDLHLANSRGNWTIVEEESMLTIRNNTNGRWFQLNMTEIDPTGRDAGMNGPPPLSTN